MSHVTNVKRASWLTHYFGMNNFKQSQLEDNRKAILDALAALGHAQVDQIYDHLLKMNQQDAQRLYEYGTITGNQKKEFIKEHTMHKRTIHRHLNNLVKSGLVECISHKYTLADKIKKDIIYWSRDFGNTLLYKLMRSYSPPKFRFEENIEEIIKIFGFYALCCLVQAVHPPVGNNNDGKMSKTDIMNRDRLVVTWIKQVFNPQRMLDYFLAIMNNLHEDNNDTRTNENRYNFHLENASDMRSERWMWFLLTSKDYDNATKPYYGLDIDTINKIMQVLEKKYKSYYKPLAEVTKNNDKQCPNCSEPNKPDSRFCAKCRMVLTYDAYNETIEQTTKKDMKLVEVLEKQARFEQLIQSLIDAGQLKPTVV